MKSCRYVCHTIIHLRVHSLVAFVACCLPSRLRPLPASLPLFLLGQSNYHVFRTCHSKTSGKQSAGVRVLIVCTSVSQHVFENQCFSVCACSGKKGVGWCRGKKIADCK